jgi:hypothetical protein
VGVLGVVNSTSPGGFSAAVRGINNGTSGSGIGVWGSHAGEGWGVYGSSVSGVAVVGSTTSGIAVYGNTSDTTGNTYGGYFSVASTAGTGVFGEVSASSGNNSGVIGQTASTTGRGVYGVASGLTGANQGVAGLSSSTSGTGVFGSATSSTGDTRGIVGTVNTNSSGWGVSATGPSSGAGGALKATGNFEMGGGSFTASPTSTTWTTNKPATVKLNDGTKVKLYAEEATEVFFSDYGIGQLQNGHARIELDPTFLQTVTISEQYPMMVFIQLESDCRGVYVTNKTSTGFDVVELQNGHSNASFSYRVVCRRKHYEGLRLAGDDEDSQYNVRMLQLVWPELLLKDAQERQRTQEMTNQNMNAVKK